MGHIPLLDELAVIAGLGVVVAVVLATLRLPTVAGLLVAGALAGPFGFRLIHSTAAIEVLAEIGVVLLLFTIGLEFSLTRLRRIFKQVAIGGSIQVGLTIAAVWALGSAFGRPSGLSLFYGFVFALSSTAIVLRALSERNELDAPHGRFIVGALIFQDLCVVPMVLIVPLLGNAGTGGNAGLHIAIALAKATAVVVATVVVSRVVVPRALAWVDASRSREVFLLAVLALCIGTAWLTSMAGLSLALGAFLGGMVVADTEFGHRALGDVLPLRDAFVSIFFISLGMLFDYRAVLESPVLFAVLLAGFVLGKGALATLAAAAMRFPARAAWLAGVGLAQFGEFGFVLTRLGQDSGIITAGDSRRLLAAGVVSMFCTPVLVRIAPHFSAGERLLAPLERLLGARGIDELPAEHEVRHGHVIIVGYGVAGRLVARALERCGVPYLVLELNAETVRTARAEGLPVYYGDATSMEAVSHAGIARARALVLVMNDPIAAVRVVDAVKRAAPEIPLLIRSRYLLDQKKLLALGATDVVAEEVESGVEMLARLLRRLEVPRNVIDDRLEEARTETQRSDRTQRVPRNRLADASDLADLKIESVLVRRDSPASGRSLLELDLRQRTGALIVAIKREGKLMDAPALDMRLQDGDIVYLVGALESISSAVSTLSPRVS
jgi:CPA2 family monovalent cation:H+ antiporter-2